MKDGYDLIDGEERSRSNPDTFEMPDRADRDGIEPGDFVKIGVFSDAGTPGERFWVKVKSKEDGRYTGTVNNDLVYTELHGLKDEDVVEFGPEHILMVNAPKPVLGFT